MEKSKIEGKIIDSVLRRATFPQGAIRENQHPCMKQLIQLQDKFASVRANYGKIFAFGQEASKVDCEQDIQELSSCLEKLYQVSIEKLGSMQSSATGVRSSSSSLLKAPKGVQTLQQVFETRPSPIPSSTPTPTPTPTQLEMTPSRQSTVPRKRPVYEKEQSVPAKRLSLRPALRKKEISLPPVERRYERKAEDCTSDEECQKRPFFNGLHPAQKVVCVSKRPRGSECVYQASQSKY